MSFHLTKFQKQGLGNALRRAGFQPAEFVYAEDSGDDETGGAITLTNRETFDTFAITAEKNRFDIRRSLPGTGRYSANGVIGWSNVESLLENWAADVKREAEAVDPWEQEAEDMAHDDSYFRLDELPRVDKAIDDSLAELKRLALDHGTSLERVESELAETKQILQKTARNSTKKEWIGIFKGIIVEKLVDWGMKTVLFQAILQVLITSAHEVAQLAEHASRFLLHQ